MPDGVFNIAKGKVLGYHDRVANNDPTNSAFLLVLLKDSAEADATLEDYDTLSALLAGANTEANFTNYGTHNDAPNVITTLSASVPDDTGNFNWGDMGDITFSAAGGTIDNALVKAIFCYDPDTTTGNDTTVIPLTHHDFSPTTNGNDLVLQIGATGYFRAT